ncbi:MAG: hypothetical protein ACPGPF_00380 [Pontibacterium sp.]
MRLKRVCCYLGIVTSCAWSVALNASTVHRFQIGQSCIKSTGVSQHPESALWRVEGHLNDQGAEALLDLSRKIQGELLIFVDDNGQPFNLRPVKVLGFLAHGFRISGLGSLSQAKDINKRLHQGSGSCGVYSPRS